MNRKEELLKKRDANLTAQENEINAKKLKIEKA
jgi:hypothetical protein